MDSKYSKQEILKIIIGERDRLKKCADYHFDQREDFLGQRYTASELAIKDLIKLLEIEE